MDGTDTDVARISGEADDMLRGIVPDSVADDAVDIQQAGSWSTAV